MDTIAMCYAKDVVEPTENHPLMLHFTIFRLIVLFFFVEHKFAVLVHHHSIISSSNSRLTDESTLCYLASTKQQTKASFPPKSTQNLTPRNYLKN